MSRNVRIIVTAVLAFVLGISALIIATPSQAASTSGYAAASCSVSPDGKARLSVTKWRVSGGTRYHADLNSSIPWFGMKYYEKSIYISGVKLSGTHDQYRNFSGTSPRKVVAYWTMSNGMTVSCVRWL